MGNVSFERILERYGQKVDVYYGESRVGVPARAFLQPVLERREDWKQEVPSPLGMARQDRFLYMGEAGVPLDGIGEGFLMCRGVRYEVQAAQAVYVGKELSHWWAVLRIRDEELEE